MTELEEKLNVIVDCLPDSPFKEKVRETHDAVITNMAQLENDLAKYRGTANCGTADSFLALTDEEKRKWFAMTIRESTRRKQAEQDADTYAAQAHKMALELECLMSEFAMVPEGAKWWDSAMNALDDWHRIRITIHPSMWEGVSPSGVVTPNVMSTAKMLRTIEPYAA